MRPVLSLIGYPAEVTEAITFVFNDTLICDNVTSAQAVTLARNVGVRSVTLYGGVYELSEVVSSGAALSGSDMVMRTAEALELEEVRGRAARRRARNYRLI